MIKKRFHSVFSMFMAVLVLCSTVSFTIQKHFCGDELVEVSVFSKANDCGMDNETMKLASVEKVDCCKNEIELIKGQDKLKMVSFEDLHFDQQLFLSTFIYSYTNLFEGLPEQISPHKDYSPPHLVADIHVLDQVFII